MGRVGVLLLALAGAACTEQVIVDVDEPLTVLVGVPVAFADSVYVTLGRSLSGSVTPVRGADLTLAFRGTTLPLAEGPSSACGLPDGGACYRGELGGRLRPGDRVELEGRLASGEALRGAAVVPGVPPLRVEGHGGADTIRGLTAPSSDVRPRLLGLEDAEGFVAVASTRAPATVWSGPEVLTCTAALPGPPPGLDLRLVALAHGSAVLSVADPCPEQPDLAWDSAAVTATFLAYDENFTDWMQLPGAVSEAAVGVDGAMGVFGAASPRRFVLLVTPKPVPTGS